MSTTISTLSTLAGDVLPGIVSALPDPAPQQPPGTEGITTILGWAKWVGLVAAILAFIFAGIMMMFKSRRGEGGENVATLGWVTAGIIVVGSATALVGFLSGA